MPIEMTAGYAPDRHTNLDNTLNEVSWGLLFMLTGSIWLVPPDRVPEGAWLFGVAAILLGVNVVRRLWHMPLNGFSLVLGLMALIAGLSRFWGIDFPLLAACFILIGASLVAKSLYAH